METTLWRQNVLCAFNHLAMINFVVWLIGDTPNYETYQLVVPINGTPYVDRIMEFNIQGALCVTHAVDMVTHLLYLWFFREYLAHIDKTGLTLLRWISYAITAPIMIVVIGILSGVRDRAALVSMATLIFVVIACGALMQSVPQYYYTICAFAFVLLTIAFTQIWVSFSAYDAPDFVTAIIFTMSFLYYSFGFVPLYARYFNKSITFQEICQNSLSLISKDNLSFLLSFGVYSMNKD